MSAPNLKPMSVEEYLRSEETSPFKREYVGGYVYPLHGSTRAQAGTSRAHVMIGQNIVRALDGKALEQNCVIYPSDMKLRIEPSSTFYYPDVMLVCQGISSLELTYETNPCFIAEVVSKSTARNDRLAKYVAYTAISSLQTYLIVEQDQRLVYAYQRGASGWASSELRGQGDIDVPCLGISVSLDQIYRRLPF
ncbi:Uma2 family endonuclease [Deinococcus sp.]|uniref:Uma2 family endonuclease n=1 Tax=Deinococcus sp. TaxID=47478 RepID=UPI0025EA2231|nr:Uma2 family endonuclease [Deinococcus sp.]